MIQEKLTQTVEIDGALYDQETGECLGIVGKPEFHVTDLSSAEWVLEKVSALDSDILAIEARLNALSENLQKMKADKEKNRNGLLYRFGPEIEKFASENLPKGKRTWVCPYGSVSFRSVPGGLKCLDKEAALDIANLSGWTNAVKVTEEFQVSKLDPAQKELIQSWLSEGRAQVTQAFVVTEPTETSTIKTGV